MVLLYEPSQAVREFAAGKISPEEFAEQALKEAEELLDGSEPGTRDEGLAEATTTPASEAPEAAQD
jgi:hypothetical protein